MIKQKPVVARPISASVVAALLAAFCWLNSAAVAQTDDRALRVRPGEAVETLPGFARRWALVIGVDQYDDGQINRLEGATNDAKALADALIRYAGFPADQVTVLTTDLPVGRRPTRGNILRRLSNFQGLIPPDGLLLVAFAGHGMERGGRAYLLPSDAQISENIALLEETAINVEVVRNWVRQTGVGQVLLILDACRNDPTAGRGDNDNILTEAYTRGFNFDVRNQEVRAFATLYATDVGHRAYEYKERKQGYFTWALVEGLKGGAANSKGEVTLARLVEYLEEVVPKRISLDLGKDKKQQPFAVIEGYKADGLVIAVTPKVAYASVPVESKGAAVAGVDPAEIIRQAQTILVVSKSQWFKATSIESELRKHPDFKAMGLKIVKDKKVADLVIELDRPLWSFTFSYTMTNPQTSIVVASGEAVKSPGGKSVSPKIAAEIIKQLQTARATPANQPKN